MATDTTPSGTVTSVIGAVAEPSMTGGLTRPQVHELFQWLEREKLLWAVVVVRFEQQLTATVGAGTATRLWHWTCLVRRLTEEDVRRFIPVTAAGVQRAFERIGEQCAILRGAAT